MKCYLISVPALLSRRCLRKLLLHHTTFPHRYGQQHGNSRCRVLCDLSDCRPSVSQVSCCPPTTTNSLTATCFFLGILFANFPYDYYVLWSIPEAVASDPTVDPRMPYFALLEDHIKFLFNSPPLISRMLHIVIGVGLLGFMIKLYKASEANLLFDGASLALYMCGVVVYIANIVKGMRTVDASAYGGKPLEEGETVFQKQVDGKESDYIGREDSLRVMAASNTILALMLVGVLVLQAGQWYAQRKEAEELEQMDKARDDKKNSKEASANSGGSKKKQ